MGASSEAFEVAFWRLERGCGTYSASSSPPTTSLLRRLLESADDVACEAWAPVRLAGGVVCSGRVALGGL
jgi:hypothetical protein